MDRLKSLFYSYCGLEATTVIPITGSGSNRQYFRIIGVDGRTLIGVIGTSKEENHTFIYLAQHFRQQKLPVPHVVAMTANGLCYLQTDLGSCSLYDAVKAGREAGGQYNEKELQLLRRTLSMLPVLQVKGAEGLDFTQCYPLAEMDHASILFDLNYFKYCFLKATGLDFHEVRLEDDFQHMAQDLLSEPSDTFLYRDFQARNVMLDTEGNPSFIDFQGGRRGPVQYDLASFLWQASARYSDALRQELIDVYVKALQQYTEVEETSFRHRLNLFVLFRLLQVLGAYGFRGYFERKKHFLDSIPPAIQNLRQLLSEPNGCPYPYLREILTSLIQLPQFNGVCTDKSRAVMSANDQSLLVVDVYSFSYRKGIPVDESGNGGGYVFDCRGTHNPGRYEPYKQLTGLDEPVIRFLEDDGEILTFLDNVYRLADTHVERYVQRGFTHLMFSFGCTGGQHRSVYCAQHLAEYLHQKFGIEVHIIHREQNITQTLCRQ